MDAFVFRNELKQWCNAGYDLIGSFLYAEKWVSRTQSLNRFFGLEKAPYYFNGGFGLYKVDWNQKLLDKVTLGVKAYITYHRVRRKGQYPLCDILVAQLAPTVSGWFTMAPAEAAKKFGANVEDDWDVNSLPFNNKDLSSLPFGAHGCFRWHPEFWRPAINALGYKV